MKTQILKIFIVLITICNYAIAQEFDAEFPIVNGEVSKIIVEDDYTYLAGNFNYIGNYTGNAVKLSTTNTNIDVNFPQFDGNISCAIPDGSGGWYVSGSFLQVRDQPRNGLARINQNGTLHEWDPQLSYSSVRKMIIHDGFLYIGGYIKSGDISVLARFNLITGLLDENWNTGLSITNHDEIDDFTIINNTIFFTGYFYSFHFNGDFEFGKANVIDATVDQTWTPNLELGFGKIIGGNNFLYFIKRISEGFELRRFDLTTNQTDNDWAIGISGGNVTEYLIEDDYIYLFGNFYTINADEESFNCSRAAKIIISEMTVDENWSPYFDQAVSSAKVAGNDIYVGGNFSKINSENISYIGRIDKNNAVADDIWRPVINGYVGIPYIGDNVVILGGNFNSVGGTLIKNLARINNATKKLDADWNFDINNYVSCMILKDSYLYIGGNFTSIKEITRNRIAAINLNTNELVEHFNPNANGIVRTLAIGNDGKLFIGGYFTKIGDSDRNRIARLDLYNQGSLCDWDINITGTAIFAITPSNLNNQLYIGGIFTYVSGYERNNVASINQTSTILNPFNPNANFSVRAIELSGDNIFISGEFTKLNNIDNLYLAKIHRFTAEKDPSFNPIISNGGGGNSISNIFQDENHIYVGSKNVRFDGVRGFAKLNKITGEKDKEWEISIRYNDYISSVAIKNDNIYFGGKFSNIGLNSAYHETRGFGAVNKKIITDFNYNNNSLKPSYGAVYPNPFTNILHFSNDIDIKTVTITNSLGQNVYSQYSLLNNSINTSNLKSGVYLAIIEYNNGIVETIKLIKK